MSLPVRHSVRIILLNDDGELLLMCIDDPLTRSVGEEYEGRFWALVGGQIEADETVLDAAIREAFEETGIGKEDIEFGPVVWFGEFDLILGGTLTHMKQEFMVARTSQRDFSLANLADYEARTVKRLEWFSLGRIEKSQEPIYPVLLPDYLPDIIAGKYPDEPFEIDLAAQTRG